MGEAHRFACFAFFSPRCSYLEAKPWVPYTCLNLQGTVIKDLALNFIWQVAAFHAMHYQEKPSLPASPEHLLPSETFFPSHEVAFPHNIGNLSYALFHMFYSICFPTDHPALNHGYAEANRCTVSVGPSRAGTLVPDLCSSPHCRGGMLKAEHPCWRTWLRLRSCQEL